MNCPNCGREIASDSRYCEFCGVKISKPKSIKILWVVLAVLLGLSALGVGSFYVYDLYKQHENEVVELKAAKSEAERIADEAKQEQLQAEEKAVIAKLQAERKKNKAEEQDADVSDVAMKRELEQRKSHREIEAKAQVYVNLGLPSGTLWKAENEDCGLISYDQAYNFYGNSLPTKEQFQELRDNCLWTWQGNGYRVKGKNGESIFLPAAGWRNCDGSTGNVGTYGFYWSSSPNGSEYAWGLYFGSSGVYVDDYKRCSGQSVRLVQKSNMVKVDYQEKTVTVVAENKSIDKIKVENLIKKINSCSSRGGDYNSLQKCFTTVISP